MDSIGTILIVICGLFLLSVMGLVIVLEVERTNYCSDKGGEYIGSDCLLNGKIYEIVNVNPWGIIPEYKLGSIAVTETRAIVLSLLNLPQPSLVDFKNFFF